MSQERSGCSLLTTYSSASCSFREDYNCDATFKPRSIKAVPESILKMPNIGLNSTTADASITEAGLS